MQCFFHNLDDCSVQADIACSLQEGRSDIETTPLDSFATELTHRHRTGTSALTHATGKAKRKQHFISLRSHQTRNSMKTAANPTVGTDNGECGPAMRSVDILDGPSTATFSGTDCPTELARCHRKYDNNCSHHHSSMWNVQRDSIRPLPPYYPLSATSCTVKEASPSCVSWRISECLRMNSVAADYDNARGMARATTPDRVVFTVRLFLGSPKKQEDEMTETKGKEEEDLSREVVVEIQHSNGCPMIFHRVCRSVLKAADGQKAVVLYGGELSSSEGRGRSCSPPFLKRRKTITSPKSPSKREVTTMEPFVSSSHQERIMLALEKAWELLNKDRMDANKLGLELLEFLTDMEQVLVPDASYASRVIMLGEDNEARSCTGGSSVGQLIQDKVMSFLLRESEDEDDIEGIKTSSDGEESINLSRDTCLDLGRGDLDSSLLSIALSVLQNSLKALSTAPAKLEVEQFVGRCPWERLFPPLHQALMGVEKNPHDAYRAASCLCSLMLVDDRVRELLVASDRASPSYREALEAAQQFGVSKHVCLARESARAANMLDLRMS